MISISTDHIHKGGNTLLDEFLGCMAQSGADPGGFAESSGNRSKIIKDCACVK